MHLSIFGATAVPFGSVMENAVCGIMRELRQRSSPLHVLQYSNPGLARRIGLSCASVQVLTNTLVATDQKMVLTAGLPHLLDAKRNVQFVEHSSGWHAPTLGRLSWMLQFAEAAIFVDPGSDEKLYSACDQLEMILVLQACLRSLMVQDEPSLQRLLILTERPDAMTTLLRAVEALAVQPDRVHWKMRVQIVQPDQLHATSGLTDICAQHLAGGRG